MRSGMIQIVSLQWFVPDEAEYHTFHCIEGLVEEGRPRLWFILRLYSVYTRSQAIYE